MPALRQRSHPHSRSPRQASSQVCTRHDSTHSNAPRTFAHPPPHSACMRALRAGNRRTPAAEYAGTRSPEPPNRRHCARPTRVALASAIRSLPAKACHSRRNQPNPIRANSTRILRRMSAIPVLLQHFQYFRKYRQICQHFQYLQHARDRRNYCDRRQTHYPHSRRNSPSSRSSQCAQTRRKPRSESQTCLVRAPKETTRQRDSCNRKTLGRCHPVRRRECRTGNRGCRRLRQRGFALPMQVQGMLRTCLVLSAACCRVWPRRSRD